MDQSARVWASVDKLIQGYHCYIAPNAHYLMIAGEGEEQRQLIDLLALLQITKTLENLKCIESRPCLRPWWGPTADTVLP